MQLYIIANKFLLVMKNDKFKKDKFIF